MIFVEGFRLLFVLAGALAGYEIGQKVDGNPHAAVWGMLLGAGLSYVLGGVVGRMLDKGLQRAAFLFRKTPPGEVFAASITSTTGMLLGLVLGLPLVVILRSGLALLIAGVFAWVLGAFGWRIGLTKGRQIVEAANLSRILAPQPGPAQGDALLADSTAVMDRLLLVLGRSGLLPAGVVVPQFVLDHVRSVAASPEPVSARRARRGLEALEAMREMGVPVNVANDEVPEADDPTTKLLTVARRTGLRIATGSPTALETAATWELPVVDLRRVVAELSPDHLPGEVLVVELVRDGRQPRQAVGYLPDGDMVVVNDATHLIDQGPIRVVVLSTRPTSQGVMVFPRLADQRGPVGIDGERNPASRAVTPRA